MQCAAQGELDVSRVERRQVPPLCVLLCYIAGAFYRCTLLLESHVNALSAKNLRPDLVAGEKLMARARELVDTTDGPMDGGSRT